VPTTQNADRKQITDESRITADPKGSVFV